MFYGLTAKLLIVIFAQEQWEDSVFYAKRNRFRFVLQSELTIPMNDTKNTDQDWLFEITPKNKFFSLNLK